MEIKLAYGKTGLSARIPDHIHTEVIEPGYVHGLADQIQAVREALVHPINHPPLQESVGSNQKVAIVFSDITRATPYHILLPALLEALGHLPDKNITLFCATGTHWPATYRELCTILGEEIVERYRVVQNNTARAGEYRYAGTTSSGNRIRFNRELMEHDLRILTGFIEPHFFAGFSGGGKALMPGMAHLDTIRYNHSIRNLEYAGTRWGVTGGNPIWEDIIEAAELATPLFLLNVTMNKDKEITGVFAGDLREAHKQGCAFAKDAAMAGVDQYFDIVITSNSGYPLDLNLYQSVKGMSAAEQVVKKGGTIVIASECRDGIPTGSDFETILHSVDSAAKLMDFVKERELQLQDTWQVYILASILMKTNVHLFSALDDRMVEKTFLRPTGDINKLIPDLIKIYGNNTRICILPEGPLTIPYLK